MRIGHRPAGLGAQVVRDRLPRPDVRAATGPTNWRRGPWIA